MVRQQIVTASGASAAVQAKRDCSLILYSAAWTSETAALELSDNGTDWQPAKDASGSAIVASGNDAFAVRGGFRYRINKSGSVASVRMTLIETLAASEK
jgi:hypothetical protein